MCWGRKSLTSGLNSRDSAKGYREIGQNQLKVQGQITEIVWKPKLLGFLAEIASILALGES